MKKVDYYMSLNYPITLESYTDGDEKLFGLNIPDLPGVWAHGETLEEAYKNLDESKKIWFETCIEKGIKIPEPISEEDYSGKFILRIDPHLHMILSRGASRKKVSLNKYITSIIEQKISTSDLVNEIIEMKETILEQTKAVNDLKAELKTLKTRKESNERDEYIDAFNVMNKCWVITASEPIKHRLPQGSVYGNLFGNKDVEKDWFLPEAIEKQK